MSLICLCVVEQPNDKYNSVFYTQQLKMLAAQHRCGIKFTIDWPEPIIAYVPKEAFVVNILDCPESDNCELFLLPDDWYSNGKTNEVAFGERMKFLHAISSLFLNETNNVELYIGQSGTNPEEYMNVALTNDNLVNYLTQTIGICGAEEGVHISISV